MLLSTDTEVQLGILACLWVEFLWEFYLDKRQVGGCILKVCNRYLYVSLLVCDMREGGISSSRITEGYDQRNV